MKHKKNLIMLISTIALFGDIDIQKNIYDSADEVIRMDEKMNQAIAQHNNISPQQDEIMRSNTQMIEDFEETKDKYILTRELNPQTDKVKVSIENGELKIVTTTKEQKQEGNIYTTIEKETESIIPIPFDADKTTMQKSYKNGVLKVSFQKKVKERFIPNYSKKSILSTNQIKEIQTNLKSEGLYNGEIDGKWSYELKSAIRVYQKTNNLTVTKDISVETLKSLGIR